MKIKISITKTELLAFLARHFTPNAELKDVELEIVEVDYLADYQKMFAEIKSLRSTNQIIPAIRRFREGTKSSQVYAKYACENLDAFIAECERCKGLPLTFMHWHT